MPPRNSVVSKTRELVRRATETRSILAVAKELGISHTGLKYFLDGGTPRSAVTAKLRHWVMRTSSADSRDRALAAELAFETLIESLPTAGRAKAVRSLLTALAAAYEGAGDPIPTWLRSKL